MNEIQFKYAQLSELRHGAQVNGFNRHNFNKRKGLSKKDKILRNILSKII